MSNGLVVILVLDQFVDVMLSPVLRRGHLENIRHAQQRFACLTVRDHLEKNGGVFLVFAAFESSVFLGLFVKYKQEFI